MSLQNMYLNLSKRVFEYLLKTVTELLLMTQILSAQSDGSNTAIQLRIRILIYILFDVRSFITVCSCSKYIKHLVCSGIHTMQTNETTSRLASKMQVDTIGNSNYIY